MQNLLEFLEFDHVIHCVQFVFVFIEILLKDLVYLAEELPVLVRPPHIAKKRFNYVYVYAKKRKIPNNQKKNLYI